MPAQSRRDASGPGGKRKWEFFVHGGIIALTGVRRSLWTPWSVARPARFRVKIHDDGVRFGFISPPPNPRKTRNSPLCALGMFGRDFPRPLSLHPGPLFRALFARLITEHGLQSNGADSLGSKFHFSAGKGVESLSCKGRNPLRNNSRCPRLMKPRRARLSSSDGGGIEGNLALSKGRRRGARNDGGDA